MLEKIREFFDKLTTKQAVCIIILAGFVVYINSLFNGFVWDDFGLILKNPSVQSFNLIKLFGPNPFNSGGFYRPVAAFYTALLYMVFRGNPFFYHFFQLALHITNGCILFFVFKKFFNQKISLFLSLIFLIHPIQVESVSFISSAQSVLLFVFGILALSLVSSSKPTTKSWFTITLLLLLSLLSKEIGFLFLIIIPLYCILFKKTSLWWYVSIDFVVSSIYFLFRSLAGLASVQVIPTVPIGDAAFVTRLITLPAAIFYYLKIFFYPDKLAIWQEWIVSTINFDNFYLPLMLDSFFFLSLIIFLISVHKKQKNLFNILLFFSIWFLVGVSFISQIFPLDMTVADRWFYFPIAGLLGIIGVAIEYFGFLSDKKRVVFFSFGVVALILLICRTFVRSLNWYDNLTLMSHDSKIISNFDIENTLGTELLKVGEFDMAISHLEKSVNLDPYDTNISNLGVAYLNAGQEQKAEMYYVKAINAKTKNTDGHIHNRPVWLNLTYFLVSHNKVREAQAYLEKTLDDYPDDVFFLQLMAIAQERLGRHADALVTAKKAYDFSPSQDTYYIYNQILNGLPIKIGGDGSK